MNNQALKKKGRRRIYIKKHLPFMNESEVNGLTLQQKFKRNI